MLALLAAADIPAAGAQDAGAAATPDATPQQQSRQKPRAARAAPAGGASSVARRSPVQYYVDFRSRTAASYGHAFVWFGRTDRREVDVAGLHPATDSSVRYMLGHVVPVPAETGASYGDLDEQYVTARFRVLMNESDARKVFAYIKHLQANSPIWHAPTTNCITFVTQIANYMGLRTPTMPTAMPETWVTKLREMNGGKELARLPSSSALADPETFRTATPRRD